LTLPEIPFLKGFMREAPACVQAGPVAAGDHFIAAIQALQGLDRAHRLSWLRESLRERSIPFSVEPLSIITSPMGEPEVRLRGANLVVTVNPGHPEVVVGAHYDAVTLPDGRPGPGASDNASGCSVLLELAAAFHENPPPGRTLRFVFFDLEEQGLRGSKAYAAAHIFFQREPVIAMLSIDVAAYGDTLVFGPMEEGNDALGERLEKSARSRGFKTMFSRCSPPSDDVHFRRAGVPALSLMSLPGAEARAVEELFCRLDGLSDERRKELLAREADRLPRLERLIHGDRDTCENVQPEAPRRVFAFVEGFLRGPG
jgi:hypothetical protein